MISRSVHGLLTSIGMNQKTALTERNLRKSMIEARHPVVLLQRFCHCLVEWQGIALWMLIISYIQSLFKHFLLTALGTL
jgi:hypothetical protein